MLRSMFNVPLQSVWCEYVCDWSIQTAGGYSYLGASMIPGAVCTLRPSHRMPITQANLNEHRTEQDYARKSLRESPLEDISRRSHFLSSRHTEPPKSLG